MTTSELINKIDKQNELIDKLKAQGNQRALMEAIKCRSRLLKQCPTYKYRYRVKNNTEFDKVAECDSKISIYESVSKREN